MTDTDLSFDADALRNKYREERDKRLRADGLGQYVEIGEVLENFAEDPHVPPNFSRPAKTKQTDVVMIGGGFGGLLIGARLRQAGIEEICTIEEGGDFGGTWYWNRYPGAACDIESYVYLPLLEELSAMPTRKYATGPEIFAHCRAIGEKFDLYRDALFQTRVTELRWIEEDGRWLVSTSRGDSIRARFVIMANGPLNRPKLPRMPGIENFEGHAFHTSRWDYAYTGGDTEGGLTGLKDRVVGIIGTGATAVQCIPHLAADASHLYVFQRTPSSVDVRADKPTSADWVASLEPGWQQKRIRNFTTLTSGGFAEEDLVQDGWTDIIGNILLLASRKIARGEPVDDPATLTQLADFKKMEQIRTRVDNIVQDKATAEALKPYYNQFCKRPCFHDAYLPAFNQPNVTLVDTGGAGVERITSGGIVVAGKEYKVDCLIYATGFEVGISFDKRVGYQIYGRDGVALTEKWREGASTLHGMHSNGFPNCFIVSHIQAGVAVNFVHMLDLQATHIAYMLGKAAVEGITRIETTTEAEDAWVAEVMRKAVNREEFLKECTPGYYNYEGNVSAMNARNGAYGGGPDGFAKVLADWREDNKMAGLQLTRGNN